jgi:hypothetical protein
MSPRGDLMERLAAADPRPDAERLSPEEQSEADALLARLLATPTEDLTDHRSTARPRTRRWALVATALLCYAAAAFAAVNLLDSDTPAPGIVEKAVAAVTREDVVYHVLERTRARPVGISGVRPMTFYYEYWHTAAGRMHRKTFAADGPRRGRLLEDMAGRRLPGRRGGPVLRWEARANTIYDGGFAVGRGRGGAPALDPSADPGTRLRSLERQGRLRFAGTARVGSRRAYRLASGAVQGATEAERVSVEFLVDSETYLPLAQRQSARWGSGSGVEFVTRFLVYERLPDNADTRRRLDLDPHPGAKCSEGAGKLKRRRAAIGFPNPCAR